MEESDGSGTSLVEGVPGSRAISSCDARTQASLEGLFDCHICQETASEPVVTLCGHMYCWGCIYQWLEVREGQQCPICKAAIAPERMVPIYGRGRPQVDPRSHTTVGERSIPTRPPAAIRASAAAPAREGAAAGSTTAAVAAASALRSAAATSESGFGVDFATGYAGDFAATLFGLGVVYPTTSHPTQARGVLSSEEEQQAILSRLLLMLGSFVILCLLIF